MSQIHAWIETPAAIALARTLLHSLWEASLAAFTLALCLRFIRESRLRYIAACGVLSVTVVLSVATFIVVVPQVAAQRSAEDQVPSRTAPQYPGATNGIVALQRNVLETVLPWLTPVWLFGVLLSSFRHGAGWVAIRRLCRKGASIAPPVWLARLDRIRVQMAVTTPVALLESCLTHVPMVIGHLRPAILMPVGVLTGMPVDQVELILMHEMAHIRRRDYLINLLQTFVESVMFYHPAVWWISSVIRTERENCCDDVVVEITNAGPLYASALAALEGIRPDQREVVMAATGGSLVKRIRRILRQPESQPSSLVPLLSAVAVVVIAAALGQSQMVLTNPYVKWLDEDVAYIITPPERAAFVGLSTDAQRDRFIEQFWVRRDPTPGTRENEFKDEHYRRIEYANEHFASRLPLPAGLGWRTDRGRIYILYGPPDEKETHAAGTYVRPDGATQTFASDFWLYRYLQGIGPNVLLEFDDPAGTGEFKQSKDPAAKEKRLLGR